MRPRSGSARSRCDQSIEFIISAMSVLASVSDIAFVDSVKLKTPSFQSLGRLESLCSCYLARTWDR